MNLDKPDQSAQQPASLQALGTTETRIIPFMKYRLPMALFSLIVVLIGVGAIAVKGLNLGLDFTGGVSAEVNYQQPSQRAQVQARLQQGGFSDAGIQYLGNERDLLIRLPPQTDNSSNQQAALAERLQSTLQLPGNPARVQKVDSVGSQVGGELYSRSIQAVVLALALMMIYVAIRFRFKLAVGAAISLLHDTLFTVGVFALFGWPFDLTVLAAVLALIGYSLNDTIVVFDRIRENFRRIRGASPVEVVDISLTETLRRTIMTVATVVVVALAMLFLGGEGLYWFSVALLVGLFAGTYSSIYIATSYALFMKLNRQDFMVTVKPEFEDDVISMPPR